MKMTITKIKENVQALLVATDYFVTVLPGAPEQESDFAGYPSASHYYTTTDNAYATVSQNRRIIEYVIDMYIVAPAAVSLADEYSRAYTLIDNVIDMLDKTIDLSEGLGVTIGLTEACDIMRPAPGNLMRVTTGEGDGLMLSIRLFCESDVSFRS